LNHVRETRPLHDGIGDTKVSIPGVERIEKSREAHVVAIVVSFGHNEVHVELGRFLDRTRQTICDDVALLSDFSMRSTPGIDTLVSPDTIVQWPWFPHVVSIARQT